MRRIALLLVVVVLVACGGDSGSENDDSTNDAPGDTVSGGAAAAAATTPPDDGESTTPDAGGGSLAQDVVTDVEPMVEPEGAAGSRALLTAGFDTEMGSKFLVGEFENGSLAEVVDGKYRVSAADGQTQIMLPTSIPGVNNGVIDAQVSIEGNGAAGVSIRSRKDPQGTFSGYVCWISEPAGAGCSSNTKDAYSLLFAAPVETVQLQETNLLRVAMIGDKLQFEVNGTVVGQFTDSGFVSGNWGLYAESTSGGVATATFDDVIVYRTTDAYQLP